MPILVIHAPTDKVRDSKRSFEETFRKGVGDGYAIAANLVSKIGPGATVVLLDKCMELRAEGKLVRLDPTEKTNNGIQRYDVRISNLKMVPYKSERLNRNGVAVI